MAILKIAKMGHPVLRQVAEPVEDPTAPGILRLVGDMMATLEDIAGAGLAAPQVHVSKRVVMFHVPPGRGDPETVPFTVLVNPRIEVLTDETEAGWEGCLSVPGLRGLVSRPAYIRYSGYGVDGQRIEREAKGFHARVVQHECDHLDGVLYPQRMDDLSRLIFESEFRHHLEEATT
ncbi:MAG: peptide deformylase [Rhizobiales bacterium NRL2]|jgi:peptide deformylase|nr:MAG: peptide deformylase [Rhizobiales bacterium NRL2]